jgi:hypothetical protein
LLTHLILDAAARAFITTGTVRPKSSETMAMTASNSISVSPAAR